ncbi:MAG TPA: nuclear transport factor 2 family protein [Terriglobia bacterium]|nr:nuclear transport factor 2 family protein [Terriglobia bacterium]
MSIYLRCCIGIWIVATGIIQIPATKAAESSDEAEFTRLEAVWNNAHLQGDADALDRLWAEELIVTVPKMPVMTRTDAVAFSRSGRMKFLRYETSDLRTRVYGDAAIVTGRLLRTRNVNGKDMSDDWRFIKVYVRREGRWQVVAWQASESAPPPGK